MAVCIYCCPYACPCAQPGFQHKGRRGPLGHSFKAWCNTRLYHNGDNYDYFDGVEDIIRYAHADADDAEENDERQRIVWIIHVDRD